MIRKESLNGFNDDITILFVLEDGEYGYGYTYLNGEEDSPYRSVSYQSRFTEEQMLDDNRRDEVMDESKVYVGEHSGIHDAVNEVLNFWLNPKIRVKIDPSLTLAEAVKVGREEDYSVVIF